MNDLKRRAVLPHRNKRKANADEPTSKRRKSSSEEPTTIDLTANNNNDKKENPGTDVVRSIVEIPKSIETQASHHMRFGSEEPPRKNSVQTVASEGDVIAASDESSDDDAPEDVSMSAAQKHAKDAVAAATRAIEQQRLTTRRKRQEREARLKAQSETAAKHKKALLAGKSGKANGVETAPNSNEIDGNSSSDDADPTLLPDDLLEEDDFDRSLTPPRRITSSKKAVVDPKRKITLMEKSTKDRQIGPVKVRVLEKSNRFLAPKASPGSRDRREAWLRGRPSTKGVRGMERKPMNSGFLST